MNIITPRYDTTKRQIDINYYKNRSHAQGNNFQTQMSFKGSPETLITQADSKVLDVFKRYYGGISDRMGKKLATLVTPPKPGDKIQSELQSKALKLASRYDLSKGVTSIKEKTLPRSLAENIIFPIVTLPSYFGSWVLKKVQSIPGNGKIITAIRDKATSIRDSFIFRVPRKINDMDALTDSLKGMFDKTTQLLTDFATEKGLAPKAREAYIAAKKANPTGKAAKELFAKYQEAARSELLALMSKKKPTAKEAGIISEADSVLRESLYKVSNKFFDKYTGNFNTAHERPLNRIVTGMIPVAFLANDAYNLSVLCGDKKEESAKEAKIRQKQEITRVLLTAYIQLLTFGAFTKQVNTIPSFAPLVSGATVLCSEIFARKRMHRPIMFLSKEGAKEYNRVHKNDKKVNPNAAASIKKNDAPAAYTKLADYNMMQKNDSNVFASFKASNQPTEQANDTSKKKETPKALINFKTFKKGVGILLVGGFALSYLKNSTFAKNNKIISGINSNLRKGFEYIKSRVYDPIAFKDFEMSEKEFKSLTGSLRKANCGELVSGHEFIKGKYSRVKDGIIKLYQGVLSREQITSVIDSSITQLEEAGHKLTDAQKIEVTKAINAAFGLEKTSIAENKFGKVTRKAAEIIRNKKLGLTDEQTSMLSEFIEKNITKIPLEQREKAIRVETKLKPFADMVTQPFKFIGSVARFPFKIATNIVNLATKRIQKKAADAVLGKAQLTSFEKAVNKVVTEIYGERSPKSGAISQTVFANAMEKLEKVTKKFRQAQSAYEAAVARGASSDEVTKLKEIADSEGLKLKKYVDSAIEKSFNGVTQSNNKNTDLAMMSKIASSTVTSAFLVADNYNMVMLKSDGEDQEGAKEKANERIIQRLSALFYQTMLINWFNGTFRNTYNSSLKGMASVSGPNTLATEILTRKSIGMPLGRKTLEELNAIDEKNEKRTGFLGQYFKFMRLLTGKKPLKDRLPKNKQITEDTVKKSNFNFSDKSQNTTNLIKMFTK